MKTSKKCYRCGLVNFATDDDCRRCSADLNSVSQVAASTPAPRSKSTLCVVLFSLALIGFGVWGYYYKKESDRELAQKAEWVRRQNDYAGHDSSTIPPPGAPTPSPRQLLYNDEQMKRLNETMEKTKMDIQPRAMPSISVPTPIRVP
jgi:hypothetical protein